MIYSQSEMEVAGAGHCGDAVNEPLAWRSLCSNLSQAPQGQTVHDHCFCLSIEPLKSPLPPGHIPQAIPHIVTDAPDAWLLLQQ